MNWRMNDMGNTQLLILAAGMGSRFGGMKQAEPIDRDGCFIIDYSVYDALQAGVSDIVIVIKKEMEHDFREAFGKRIEGKANVSYAFQNIAGRLGGFDLPAGRAKPWGTGHAVLSARDKVSKPFMVINSDDFYGRAAYAELARISADFRPGMCAMAGYKLGLTLSESGGVKRAICETDAKGCLTRIEEHTGLERSGDAVKGFDGSGKQVSLSPEATVSLNFWCFHNTVFDALESSFSSFLKNLPKGGELEAEFYLPSFVQEQIDGKSLTAGLVPVSARWHGITFREDLASLKDAVEEYKRQGIYPERLWVDGR
jgi:hypothetical protein